MGTRGFVGFTVDGTEKIAYNHFDSYPDALGIDVLTWLRSAAEALDALTERVRALRVVDPNSTPTADEIEQLRRFAKLDVGTQQFDDWYVLLRETQGNPELMLEAGVIEDGSRYAGMQYGYLVDLDKSELRVYDGDRSADVLAAFPFDALPTDDEFIARLEGGE